MVGPAQTLAILGLLLKHGLSTSPSSLACPGNTTADDVLATSHLQGKLAVVTGGDSGLGYASALAFAKRGATVVIATHNQSKGATAAKEIASLTGADVSAPWLLDLSSLASVRSFATSFLSKFGTKLNILVNNAGISSPSIIDKDGFELVFEVDYLGHFLLTELLLPALRNGRPSQIINIGSGVHENACESAGWPEGCFKDFTYLPPPAIPVRPVTVHYHSGPSVTNASSYGIGKFLVIQHAAELARREAGQGVKAFSVTPGLVNSSFLGGFPQSMWQNKEFVKIYCAPQVHPAPNLPAQPCPFSAGQAAAVVAFCASGDPKSGLYYSRGYACEERPVVDHGMTAEVRSELYSRSLEWVGLKREELVFF